MCCSICSTLPIEKAVVGIQNVRDKYDERVKETKGQSIGSLQEVVRKADDLQVKGIYSETCDAKPIDKCSYAGGCCGGNALN
eukprot:2580776-Amphidinium_carterae.1